MRSDTPTTAEWQRLYELAAEVKALAPWTWMVEGDVFGVRQLESDDANFVSVMGSAGEHLAVAVYLGSEGLRGFLDLCQSTGPHEPEQVLEIPHLQVSFENRGELEVEDRAVIKELGMKFRGKMAWPMFRSGRPGYLPWLIEGWEARALMSGLEQMLDVAPRAQREPLLLSSGDSRTYLVRVEEEGTDGSHWTERRETLLLPESLLPEPGYDARQAKELGQLGHSDASVELSLFATVARVQKGRERPSYPYTLMMVDSRTGMISGADVLGVDPDLMGMLASVPGRVCALLAKEGEVPGEIRTGSGRLVHLLAPLCEAAGIQLHQVDSLPQTELARESLEAHLDSRPPPGGRARRSSAMQAERRESPVRDAEVTTGTAQWSADTGGVGRERIGRNAPCPCGSGKKYKKCCLLKEQAGSNELTPRLLQRRLGEAASALAEHASRICAAGYMASAWADFWALQDEGSEAWEMDNPFAPLFFPWMMYLWIPDEADGSFVETHFPSERTVAASYLQEAGTGVDELTRRYIDAARRSPLSFWQVEALEPGQGALLRDMVTPRECFVHDKGLSEDAEQWEILLCQVVEVDQIAVLGAMAPYLLPPEWFRRDVEAFAAPWREQIHRAPSRHPALLLEADVSFIGFYHECVDKLTNPRPPEMRNTDGDPLEWATSTYSFDPAQHGRLVGRLESMRNIEPLEGAGEGVQFVWVSRRKDAALEAAHKAHIWVQDEVVVTECNSRRRDRNLRQRFKKNLGELLRHEGTEYEEVDLEDSIPEEGTDDGALDPDSLMPGDCQKLMEVMGGRYMRWADESVPALNGQTPREAMQTQEGREEVEKMINEWDHMQRRGPSGAFQFDFNRLRRELGLAEE